jgi:hypothetical protein
MAFTVYISYSRKDKNLVNSLYSVLKQNNINTYALDVTILPQIEGSSQSSEIKKFISSSDYVFVLLTEEATKSSNVFYEIGLARALLKPILLILEPQVQMPKEVKDLPYIILDRNNVAHTMDQIQQLSARFKSQKESGNTAMGILILLGALAFLSWLSEER